MKKHLNTLFVTTQGAYLSKNGEAIVVKVDGREHKKFPIHMLGGIVCFGNVGCSPFVMGQCGERGIAISFLTENGRFLARVHGKVSGNVLLRRTQYRTADDKEASAGIAAAMVAGKVANCRVVLQRAIRDHGDNTQSTALQTAVPHLTHSLRKLKQPRQLDTIRGIEGDAARCYFGCFNCLITTQKNTFVFSRRQRRPPTDNVNALLSFLYTLVRQDCQSALEAVGLDPAVGYLHRERPGRPALALDLMEELRPVTADRTALSLINLRQVQAKDFEYTDSGAVHLKEAGRKEVITAYQKRKQVEIVHPFIEEKITVGLLPHIQARLLARHLRGDLDGYPPYLRK